jgi:uncharacterized protein (UPF0335 family)
MGRPAKFRHSLEDLQQPHLAQQLAGYVEEIEVFRKQLDEIQQHIAAIYDDVDGEGFDKSAVRKIVGVRSKPADQVVREEETMDAYSRAVDAGFSSRARVGNQAEAA